MQQIAYKTIDLHVTGLLTPCVLYITPLTRTKAAAAEVHYIDKRWMHPNNFDAWLDQIELQQCTSSYALYQLMKWGCIRFNFLNSCFVGSKATLNANTGAK